MSPEHVQIPPDIAAVNDYVAYARDRLPADVWDYIHSGSADDITFAHNEAAFWEIQLNSRVLRNVSSGNTRTQLLGRALQHPVILAPVAYQKLAHRDGEIATALAAQAQDALFVLSTLASTSIEDVAAASQGLKWFQLYFLPSRDNTLTLVRRAEAAGYEALMVTIDAPINGLRNRLHRAGFKLPDHVAAVNIENLPAAPAPQLHEGDSPIFQHLMAVAPTWEDIRWLQTQTDLPLIIKGIMHPDDACMARELGAQGIVVSNHGGRILDTAPAAIEVLPHIAAAADGAMAILFDGGIRRGSDIFKALALGADAVMIGRPVMYALATAGAMGVAHVLRLLKDELELTMALCGCGSIEEINKDCLWQRTR